MWRMLLYGLLFFYAKTLAQENFVFNHYTTEHGLSNNNVSDILQDDDGFIWLATANGLNRFDGTQFKKYYKNELTSSLPDNTIHEIKKWKDHQFVLATAKGLGIFNTQTGDCKRIILSAAKELMPQTNTIERIAVTSHSEIIAGSYTGIFVFNEQLQLVTRLEGFTSADIGKKWLRFSKTIDVFSNGDALIQTSNGFYIYHYDQKKIIPLSKEHDNFYTALNAFTIHHRDNILTINHDKIFLIDYKSHIDSIYVLDISHNKPIASPLHFSVQKYLAYWSTINFQSDSLFTISSEGWFQFFSFNIESLEVHSLNSLPVSADLNTANLFFDDEHRLWAGSENGAYVQSLTKNRFQQKSIDNYSGTKTFFPVSSIYRFNGKYYVASSNLHNCLLVLDTNFHLIRQIDLGSFGHECNNNWSIDHWSKDTLILATQQGIILLNTSNYWFGRPLYKNWLEVANQVPITTTFKDSRGIYWLGLGQTNGTLAFNTITQHWTQFFPGSANTGFKLRYPAGIAEDIFGNVWMLQREEGIIRWNYRKQIFDTLITSFKGFDANENNFSGLAADKKGNLWLFFSTKEIAKWNLINMQIQRFVVNDLPNNDDALFSIVPGQIWVTCNNSLIALDTKTGQLKTLNKTNGLPDITTTSNNLYYDTVTKKLMAGYNNTVCIFNPYEIFAKEKPKKIFITEINVLSDSTQITLTKEIRLKYFQNDISIHFSAINFETGMDNEYEYRLDENNDTKWINIGRQQFITLNNLPPGNYLFQVRLASPDKEQQQQVVFLNIAITPPFYQTWWFDSLSVILAAIMVYALYRYRMNQLIQLHNVRNRISNDLHDDIGSTLSSISIMSSLGTKGDSTNSKEILETIGENAKMMQESMSDIVWNINPKYDAAENIFYRMRMFGSEILEAKNIHFRFMVDEQMEKLKLDMESRRSFYLIYKEAINNIAKYSGAKNAFVSIVYNNGKIVMSITDDGVGFEEKTIHEGNGLFNMRARAKNLNGEIVVDSHPSKGTRIELTFKV